MIGPLVRFVRVNMFTLFGPIVLPYTTLRTYCTRSTSSFSRKLVTARPGFPVTVNKLKDVRSRNQFLCCTIFILRLNIIRKIVLVECLTTGLQLVPFFNSSSRQFRNTCSHVSGVGDYSICPSWFCNRS